MLAGVLVGGDGETSTCAEKSSNAGSDITGILEEGSVNGEGS